METEKKIIVVEDEEYYVCPKCIFHTYDFCEDEVVRHKLPNCYERKIHFEYAK